VLDAVQCAAALGKPVILRALLEHDSMNGRFDTAEGRETLTTCLELGGDVVDCYDAVKLYLGGDREPSVDLIKAFLEQDEARIDELLRMGVTISAQQAVSYFECSFIASANF
jgi:hypothetical protein